MSKPKLAFTRNKGTSGTYDVWCYSGIDYSDWIGRVHRDTHRTWAAFTHTVHLPGHPEYNAGGFSSRHDAACAILGVRQMWMRDKEWRANEQS